MDIQVLGEVSLSIPAWQMGLFVGLVSLFMLQGHIQSGLSVFYLFVLYWGFVVHRSSFVTAAGDNLWVISFYICCGLTLAFLALVMLFYESY